MEDSLSFHSVCPLPPPLSSVPLGPLLGIRDEQDLSSWAQQWQAPCIYPLPHSPRVPEVDQPFQLQRSSRPRDALLMASQPAEYVPQLPEEQRSSGPLWSLGHVHLGL